MRIAIYSRKSIETDTGESIQNQINMCKEYFLRQHKECTFEVFEDEGFSGGNTNRPSFQRMMTLVKMKQFDIIAVYKIDRIARNIVDFVNIFDEMENYKVQLVSITEGFDPSTPVGRMMMLLLASFAEMERMNIAQRVKDNMLELAKLGRWSGGTPPYAYKTIKSEFGEKKVSYLELIPEQSEVIKTIFEQYAEGYTSFDIKTLLKSKGFDLSDNLIIDIIKNPTYLKSSLEAVNYLKSIGYAVYGDPNGCGFLPYNRRPTTKGVKSYNDKRKIAGISTHVAIIDLDLWVAAHEKLKSKFQDPRPRESNFTFLSGGIVKCRCGSSMEVCVGRQRIDGSRLYYFRCAKTCGNLSLRVDTGEIFIDNFIKELLNKNQLIDLSRSNKPTFNVEKEIKEINKKINQNTAAVNNLVDKLAFMSSDSSQYIVTKIEELSKQNNNLKETLLSHEREKLFKMLDDENLNAVYNYVKQYVSSNDIEVKRRVIKNILKSVTWDSDTQLIGVNLVDI